MPITRKNIRLSRYDYSQGGYYFVTICTQNRENLFGHIVGARRDAPAQIVLNEFGKIVESIWQSLSDHHPVTLDAFQIMPNHIHFIIHISGRSHVNNTGGSRSNEKGRSRPTPTLGWLVGIFKSECTKQIRRIVGARRDAPLRIFQRNYYEHIIRNETEYLKIKEYIRFNPIMWERDRNNPTHDKN